MQLQRICQLQALSKEGKRNSIQEQLLWLTLHEQPRLAVGARTILKDDASLLSAGRA